MSGSVRLADFDNSWYRPGRSAATRALWLVFSRAFFLTSFPWPSRLKATILRAFGGRIGRRVVLKPRINVKYPWNLTIGDDCWIGEGAWIDSLGQVTLGHDVCLSQGAMIETGNHDWSDPAFGLKIGPVVVEDGAWAAVRSLLLPGSSLRAHSVLSAGSVLKGDTEASAIYVGNPAAKVRDRVLPS